MQEEPTSTVALPGDLLARVLTRVPLQHRLKSCAAVSTAWRAAAAASTCATGKLKAELSTLAKLALWLQQHAQCAALQQLSMSGPNAQTLDRTAAQVACGEHPGPSYPDLKLPVYKLPNLSSLSLEGLWVAAIVAEPDSGCAGTAGRSSGSSITGSGYLDVGVGFTSSTERQLQLQQWWALDKQERQSVAALRRGRRMAVRKVKVSVLAPYQWLRSAAFVHLRCLKKLSLVECSVNLHGIEEVTALEDLTLDCIHELSIGGTLVQQQFQQAGIHAAGADKAAAV